MLERALDEEVDIPREKRSYILSVVLKFSLIIGGAGAGALHFVSSEHWNSPSSLIGIVLNISVIIVGGYLLILDWSAPAEVGKARRAISSARQAQRKFENLSKDYEGVLDEMDDFARTERRQSELYLAMHTIAEWAKLSLEQSPRPAVQDTLREVLKLVGHSLRIACNFEMADHYTICIYEARRGSDGAELHCIAHDRSIWCELEKARTWKSGVGVGEVCFANKRSVTVADMSHDDGSWHTDSAKPDDIRLYQSVTAHPSN